MRLGGRLAAAIEVLEDIGRRHRPVADALKDWGLSHRFAGGGDRAAIGNIVYDALRRKRSAGWLLGEDTPRAIGFGALLLEWSQTAQSLNAALEGDKFAPPLLSATELQAIAERRLADAPPAVRADIPDWCEPLFQRAFGETWVEEGAALATRPPLDIRVNTLQADRAKVLAELAQTGASAARIAPYGIRIPPIDGDGRHPNVQAEPAFQKGWFEVQDEGSQIAAALAGATAGMQVLDFCAGAGGKTLALSAAMDNHGQIFAHDAEKARLAPIFDRIRRSENRNVQVATKPAELAPLTGHMDIVLVDAPCTGSGTWRRRPDAKWRLTQRQLDARKGEQATILDAARTYVKLGGLLVYVTCSVFDEENGEQIAAFRERHSGFAPVDHRQLWDSRFPGHTAAMRIGALGGISLSPALSGTDGFYFCAMRRAN
ncbi:MULTISPECIES: RsmB/NOP family class I SAM-dependent RNA methyltransferase [unclassified Mesorhizobium]|uniref:RsmB/NOP family class I SAM-dependent RNA methyltransferase n=1 Tax=unclassified Mesorhizobium TaxID=325217 RepID=UPI001CCC1CE1|nr:MULTISPECIES: RsmB/NOP family class I SAM-dependent RNA methyltransferase [unclassified Mesorhizobium]MBZ9682908.1 RsmB/NOP family class I SAM-dependent RNA methyltransferase [Mesorhizobium sp. CO1-1-2]MBZ9927697.1 RsmB/NOP family class I SAM-dependent RNA methyltransferase [Mesorhizobium sp. BR1-1-4]